ncbi:uroporphyrinogen-III synthase [Oceanobacillus sp. CAU 1775]
MINLKGQRILVTREVRAAERFEKLITNHNGVAITVPLLTINCLPVKSADILTEETEWVFFTSKNGVDCFLKNNALKTALASYRIAAVGPKTAQALEAHGFQVEFIPSTYNADVMASEFLSTYEEVGSVLFVRGTLSSQVLPKAFNQAGRNFTCLEVYETVSNVEMKNKLNTTLQQEKIDLLTFTSPSTIHAFFELTENPEAYLDLPVACIGTTTEQAAIHKGFKKTIVPEHFTIEGMVEAMSNF